VLKVKRRLVMGLVMGSFGNGVYIHLVSAREVNAVESALYDLRLMREVACLSSQVVEGCVGVCQHSAETWSPRVWCRS